MFRWLRNYARAKTLFMDPHYAAEAKGKLALTYAFLGWNLFGLIVYWLYQQKVPKIYDSVDYAKIYGVKDAKVVKFSGFTKVDEYNINISDEELDEYRDLIGTQEEKKLYEEKRAAEIAMRAASKA